MITSEERRTIAARIDKHTWGDGDYAGSALISLAECLGVDDEDIMGRSYGYIARMVASRVRELCEVGELDAMSNDDLLAHGLMRLPIGADGEPIRPGDVVTHPDMGGRREVTSVCLTGEGVSVGCADGFVTLRAGLLNHADTPSTLADEIDRWIDGEQDPDEPYEPLRSIARRLRALGGGGDE